jgi:chromate transport protein ChrA
MFNFSAYLGALAMRETASSSIFGALLAYAGIFAPGLVLQTALLPIWDKYRKLEKIRVVLSGVISSAVGLIYAALFILIKKAVNGTSLLESPAFTIIASSSFVLCGWLKVPMPVVIALGGIAGLATRL